MTGGPLSALKRWQCSRASSGPVSRYCFSNWPADGSIGLPFNSAESEEEASFQLDAALPHASHPRETAQQNQGGT